MAGTQTMTLSTPRPDSQDRATILFAHGSRDPLWQKPIEAVATHTKLLNPSALVCCAFLELTRPDLATCVDELASRGITHVSILPMFLGVGKHAREDLPLLVNAQRALHPQIQFDLQAPIGEHPELVELVAKIALEPWPRAD
jgi:sirohydrochlorin cobaltochelatase